MPVIASAYDTYMGRNISNLSIDKIESQLIKVADDAAFNYQSSEISPWPGKDTKDIFGIMPGSYMTQDIDYFAHPIVLLNKRDSKENSLGGMDNFKVIFDLRGVVGEVRGQRRITEWSTYAYMCARAVINHWWISHGYFAPINSMPVAMSIFANVIGEECGKTIAMSMDDALRVRTWAAIWYYMAHMQKHLPELKSDEKFRIMRYIQQHLKIDHSFTETVLEAAISGYADTMDIKAEDIGSIYHWFKLAPQACDSVRLEGAFKDIGSFIGMIGRAYIGPLNVETMSIAFEHPPTWLALVWAAANSYGVNNSALTKMTQRPIYRDGVTQLVRGINTKLELSQ